ncbi:MAG: M56 family metallopeptidase [Thermoplasmata archaeon]
MMSLGLGLLLALLMLIALGSAGYLLSKRPAGKNRSVATTIFAYGMFSSSLALIPLSLFHFHTGEHAGLHIHGIGKTFEALAEECGLPIACAINELLIITAGVLLLAFVLNQVASRLMMRRFRNREDPGMSRSLRSEYGVEDSISLYVVKDANPDAFSFAILERGRYALPRGRDVIIITTALVELLDKDELRTVAAHELAHVKGRDNRYAPFFHALSALVFFDPLMRLLKNRVVRREEFIADKEAALSTGNPLGLARALGKVLIHTKKCARLAGSIGLSRGHTRKVLLERIKRLIKLAEELDKDSRQSGVGFA